MSIDLQSTEGQILQKKIERWQRAAREAKQLETEIKKMMSGNEGVTIEVEGARVIFNPTGKGTYDYEALAMRLEPDTSVIEEYTASKVDWRGVCQHEGYTDEMLEQHYHPGKPTTTFKLT